MPPSLRPVSLIAQIIFAVFLGLMAIRLAHYHWASVTFPYSIALREGAMMVSTDALVKGLNPYDMSLQPQFMNEYGIGYPLMVWPLAKIFGTTILVHRIVIAFFILASCVLLFLVLKKMAIPLLLNCWTVLMLYASLTYPGTSTATIDAGAPGTFFFLLTLFVPWFCRYSYKSLIISVVFGILAFYTKLYTFLGVLILISYLFLFVSKIRALFYSLLLMLLLVISIMVVNQLLPAYFDNCFFSEVNMAPAWASTERLYSQINMYKDIHHWVLILLGIFFIGYVLKKLISWAQKGRISKEKFNLILSVSSLKDFNQPLIHLRLPLYVFAGLWSAAVIYFSMGRNTGATLWYFFQLLSPFFLISASWAFSRSQYWPILCIPFLILNLLALTKTQDYTIFKKSELGWPQLAMAIKEHQHILNSPLIAPLMIEQNKEIVDDGQAEYFILGGRRDYWMKGRLKEDERVFDQMMMYFVKIRSMVQNKQFDLIILQPTLLPLGVADDINKNYKYEGTLSLYTPQDHRSYQVTFWKPL